MANDGDPPGLELYGHGWEDFVDDWTDVATSDPADAEFVSTSYDLEREEELAQPLEMGTPKRITPPGFHDVVQGETLGSIAELYGFADCKAIWSHSQNAALKTKRRKPGLLLPGDKIFIPERRQKWVNVNSGARHTFVMKRPRAFFFGFSF